MYILKKKKLFYDIMKTPLKKYMKINTLKILLNCSWIPLPAPAELALGLTVYTRGPARVRELSKI